MCCLDDRDEPTAEPDNDASQSQQTETSYSQSLTSRRAVERDDQSVEESRAESRAASRASSSRVKVDSHDDSRAESQILVESDSDKSDGEDEPAGSVMASSAASLFGSVVRHVDPQTTNVMSRRSTRRRLQSSEGRTASGKEKRYDSDGSRDLLADSSDDEVELQELDVSSRRNTSNNETDRGNTSSPELVYGRQE
eukprot:scaffold3023_cov175-Amphora_coffeaeformis.AAC.5